MPQDLIAWCDRLPTPGRLAAEELTELAQLGLSWCDPAQRASTLLLWLPRAVEAPAGAPAHRWWRHVYGGACLALRLLPDAGQPAALAAAFAAAAPMLVGSQAPRRLLAAELEVRRSRRPLAEALAQGPAPIRLGEVAGAWASAWQAGEDIARALRRLDQPAPWHDPLAAAVATARWLLALKRMRAPLETCDPVMDPGTIASLGLDARGLVAAIQGLTQAADEGRQLALLAGPAGTPGPPPAGRRAPPERPWP